MLPPECEPEPLRAQGLTAPPTRRLPGAETSTALYVLFICMCLSFVFRSLPPSIFFGEFRPLRNHRCFLKIQPRIAWVEPTWVSIAQVAEKIDLPLAVRKEFRIQFVCVKAGQYGCKFIDASVLLNR